MRIFFGPVDTLGHPFYPHPMELVVERSIGAHDVFCFSRRWLRVGPELDFSVRGKPDVVAVFDPMFLNRMEFGKLCAHAYEWDVPVVLVLGDWFHGLRQSNHDVLCGTIEACKRSDGALLDLAGAIALKGVLPSFPTRVNQEIWSYGRLIERGGNVDLVLEQDFDRECKWDVGYVGSRYPHWVPSRPYWLEMVHEICDKNGWSFLERNDVPASELESTVADCRVTFNLTPGYAANIRIYEAMACASILLTESWNPFVWNMLGGRYALFWRSRSDIESILQDAIDNHRHYQYMKHGAAKWVATKHPDKQWSRTFNNLEDFVARAT